MKIVRDQYVFSQDFIPERIMLRDDEINKLNYLLFGNNISATVVLKGNPGTGKTLIAKYLMKSIPSYESRYINCYTLQNEKSIIAEIVGRTEMKADILNTNIDKALKMMLSAFKTEKNFIILDEAHSLRKRDNSFLYYLSRSQELGGPPIKLLLATIEDPEIFLDRSILSGIGKFNRITLKEYSAEELYQIIIDRANAAFYEGTYENDAIKTVAELSEENGSARIAIELLNNSVLLAESVGEILTSEMVLKAFREFSPPIDESSLMSLDLSELQILDNLITLSVESRFRVADVRAAMHEDKDSRVYKFLSRLEDIGLVKKSKLSGGYKKGVQNEYVFKIPQEILEQKIKMMRYNSKI